MSSLTQTEKLRALGLKRPDSSTNPYSALFDEIASQKDYSTFSSDVNGQASFSEFETYLTDTIGMSSADAARFRSRMEQKYASFSDFQSALSGFSSYEEWKGSFSWGTTIGGDTTDGDKVTSGVRIHGEDGVSYDDVAVGKGTVEVFGPRIEFSQTDAAIDASTDFAVTNLTVSDTTPQKGETINISADITNNSGYGTDFTAKLLEDSSVKKTKTVSFDPSETKTVSFSRTYSELVSVEVQINDSGTQTVSVEPEGIA
jgi:hypothetical protein